jgi:hypothetical protein
VGQILYLVENDKIMISTEGMIESRDMGTLPPKLVESQALTQDREDVLAH